MSPEDTEKKGPGGTVPGKGKKDLDELKAKLGLKKPAPKGTAPAGSAPAQKKTAADDFKFSFGDAQRAEPAMSAAELATIDAEAHRATSPIGRKIAVLVVGLVLAVVLLWLGYQFGNSMGLRTLHNQAVIQSQEIKSFFLAKYANATGVELDARRDTTTKFIDTFDVYHEEHIMQLMAYAKVFSEGKTPPDFELQTFVKDELAPVKAMCKEFLIQIEEYSVAGVLKGQLYSTELGAKLLEFADRANKLRNQVQTLYLSIELVEAYALTAAMAEKPKPEVLVHALKIEKDKETVPVLKEVEISGTPELDKELKTREICEPVSFELEIPLCGARKGEPEVEKRLIDTYDRKEVQEVTQFRKVKVKDSEGKSLSARIEHLFKMDLRPHLMPLLEKVFEGRTTELKNLGTLVATVSQNMNDVRIAGETVDFSDVIDSVEKFAIQELFFTF